MGQKRVANQLVDDETGEILATEVTVAMPLWKTPYNHDLDAESKRTGLTCRDPSKTQQQFAAEADINNILAKFRETGIAPTMGNPVYLDIETEYDLQDAMVTQSQVDEAWNNLPIEARAILQTPAKFVEWYDKCLAEGNVEGLRQIGLIPPEKAPEPPKPPTGGTPAPDDGKPPAAPTAAAAK